MKERRSRSPVKSSVRSTLFVVTFITLGELVVFVLYTYSQAFQLQSNDYSVYCSEDEWVATAHKEGNAKASLDSGHTLSAQAKRTSKHLKTPMPVDFLLSPTHHLYYVLVFCTVSVLVRICLNLSYSICTWVLGG